MKSKKNETRLLRFTLTALNKIEIKLFWNKNENAKTNVEEFIRNSSVFRAHIAGWLAGSLRCHSSNIKNCPLNAVSPPVNISTSADMTEQHIAICIYFIFFLLCPLPSTSIRSFRRDVKMTFRHIKLCFPVKYIGNKSHRCYWRIVSLTRVSSRLLPFFLPLSFRQTFQIDEIRFGRH